MACLIAGELITLHFAMTTLSAVRAFVGGEGMWSKAQKNAIYKFQRYAATNKESDYRAYQESLKIPRGDHIARMELSKPKPNLKIVEAGFRQGQVDPDDIPAMIDMLNRFYWFGPIASALDAWSQADEALAELEKEIDLYHQMVLRGAKDTLQADRVFNRVDELNEKITVLEDHFSFVLGQGSRAAERICIFVLFMVVLLVESVGLTMTYFTSRAISKGLGNLIDAANRMGKGDFSQTLSVHSRDEIGQLTEAVNQMGQLLKKSQSILEETVAQRTKELRDAIKIRDEFISVGSHELKTPLTSLKLQSQMRRRTLAQSGTETFTAERLKKMLEDDERQLKRLDRLVDDMVDIVRLYTGKLSLRTEKFDLVELVTQVAERFAAELAAAKCELKLELGDSVVGEWDRDRIEQVFSNLLSNAIKYGPGKPVHVSLKTSGSGKSRTVCLTVADQGAGIAKEDHARIFKQFERAVPSESKVTGLGLGLYIVNQIVEAHQGRIALESDRGLGARFAVELPA